MQSSGPQVLALSREKKRFDWKRLLFILTGIVFFAIVYFFPPWPDAVDPTGAHFILTREGRGPWLFFCWLQPGGFSKWCPSA